LFKPILAGALEVATLNIATYVPSGIPIPVTIALVVIAPEIFFIGIFPVVGVVFFLAG